MLDIQYLTLPRCVLDIKYLTVPRCMLKIKYLTLPRCVLDINYVTLPTCMLDINYLTLPRCMLWTSLLSTLPTSAYLRLTQVHVIKEQIPIQSINSILYKSGSLKLFVLISSRDDRF
jgi:hypothetical protein